MNQSKIGSIVFNNGLQEPYRNTLRNVPRSSVRTLNIETDLSYREQLSALYSSIEDALDQMTTCLALSEDHPADITKDDASLVRDFLKESDIVMKGSFELFVGMSER